MSENVARKYVKMGVDFLMKLTSLPQSEMKVLVHLVSISGFSGEARITQEEMKTAVGVSLRAISKAYSKLKSLGIIAVAGHGRVVLNPDVVMRGNEADLERKRAKYRAALNGKPEPKWQAVEDSKAFLDSVIGQLEPQVEEPEDDELWPEERVA